MSHFFLPFSSNRNLLQNEKKIHLSLSEPFFKSFVQRTKTFPSFADDNFLMQKNCLLFKKKSTRTFRHEFNWMQKKDNQWLAANACILTTLNKYVDDMNKTILDLQQGEEYEFLSADYFGPEKMVIWNREKKLCCNTS